MADYQIDNNTVNDAILTYSMRCAVKSDNSKVFYTYVQNPSSYPFDPEILKFRKANSQGGAFSNIVNIDYDVPITEETRLCTNGNVINATCISRPSGGTRELRNYRSTDDGDTWSAYNVLDTGYFMQFNSLNLPFDKSVIHKPDGVVGIAYQHNDDILIPKIKFVRSIDGGANFSKSLIISNGLGVRPLMATDNNSKFYVVWHQDERPDKLSFCKSLSNGRRWTDPTIIATGKDLYGTFGYRLDADNYGNVYILWCLFSFETASSDLYLSVSNDSGETWNSPVFISTAPAAFDLKVLSRTNSTDSLVYITYHKNTNKQIYVRKSINSGISIDAETSITGPQSFNCYNLHVGAHSNNVVVTWETFPSGVKVIRYQKSSNRGTSWLPGELDLSTGAEGNVIGSDYAVSNDDYLYGCWNEERNGDFLKYRIWGNHLAL